jgi:phage replication-related protein YjqB (UPF0714/DUF867 family)
MGFSEVLRIPGVTETLVLGRDVGMFAPHGSSLEDGTERIASEVASRTGCSLYLCTYPGTWEESRGLHVSSTVIQPGDSPALSSFFLHCRTVIAVHGFSRSGLRHAALIGGGNRRLATLVAKALRRSLPPPAEVLDGPLVPVELRGTNPENLANRFPDAGSQVELAPRLRVPYPNRLFWGGCTPNPNVYADAVVDGLCEAVDSYTAPL